MDLMFVISNPEAGTYLGPLLAACERRGLHWSCFFTNDGVRAVMHDKVRSLLPRAAQAAVCGDSWKRFMGDADCPIEVGSQTEHSALVAEAEKIVSL